MCRKQPVCAWPITCSLISHVKSVGDLKSRTSPVISELHLSMLLHARPIDFSRMICKILAQLIIRQTRRDGLTESISVLLNSSYAPEKVTLRRVPAHHFFPSTLSLASAGPMNGGAFVPIARTYQWFIIRLTTFLTGQRICSDACVFFISLSSCSYARDAFWREQQKEPRVCITYFAARSRFYM